MCFEFQAWLCFGFGKGHDYGRSSARGSAKPTTPHYYYQPPPPPPQTVQRNGKLPVADEEDRKASNDHRRGHNAHAAATKSVHGYAGAGAHEKAYVYPAADGTLSKHPATTNAKVVADGAQYHYYQERQPAHKQEYYHYH